MLRLIRALQSEGPVDRQRIAAWLAPSVKGADGTSKQRPAEGLNHTLTFATELQLIGGPQEGPWTTDRDWDSIDDVADSVHNRLCSILLEDDDALFFAVYAALILRTSEGWTPDLSKKDLIGELDDKMKQWRRDKTANFFSDAKAGTFEDWAGAMGLLLAEDPRLPFVPYPVNRMRREITALGAKGQTLGMPEFWHSLIRRMPYLDEGSIWDTVRTAANAPAFSGQLSPATSWALLRMEQEGSIHLRYMPDAPTTYRLFGRAEPVSTVVVEIGG
jgi:hypothetical protein